MVWIIGGFFVASGLFAALVLARITSLADKRWNTMLETQGKEPYGV